MKLSQALPYNGAVEASAASPRVLYSPEIHAHVRGVGARAPKSSDGPVLSVDRAIPARTAPSSPAVIVTYGQQPVVRRH
jgi:hypothetical protein